MRHKTGLTLGLTLALTAGAACADSPAALQRLCYARTYDAAHLAQHPAQRVTELGAVVAEDETIESSPVFRMTISVKLRGRSDRLTSAELPCSFYEPGGMQSGMAEELALADVTLSIGCDVRGGGQVTIDRTARGTGLLKLQNVHGFVVNGRCKGGSCSYDLRSGPDDNGFLLQRTSDAVCAEMQQGVP